MKQMESLERHKEKLILTDQVRMEYLKNRQRVVNDTLKELKKPNDIGLPPILSDYKPAQMIKKHIKNAQKKFSEVREKAANIIANPSGHDLVYKSINRIFDSDSDFNLTRTRKERYEVRRLARKRYLLGYPPRKASDTSIGDALNWEWIIKCAEKCSDQSHILIVSRDGDYGFSDSNQSFLNDWLRREFKERVSRKRRIELTAKLTVALKRLDELVSPEDESEEEKVISSARHSRLDSILSSALLRHNPNMFSNYIFKNVSLRELDALRAYSNLTAHRAAEDSSEPEDE